MTTVAPEAAVHDVPVGPRGLTNCCRRRAAQLPDNAGLTEDLDLVTCIDRTDPEEDR